FYKNFSMAPEENPLRNLTPEVRPTNLPAPNPYGGRTLVYPEISTPTDQLSLGMLWRIVRRRWWLIAGITFVVTGLVAIQMYKLKTLYQATATVEIGHDNGTRVNSAQVIIQDNEAVEVAMNTSQIVLRSTPLLEDVASELQLDKSPAFLDVTQ